MHTRQSHCLPVPLQVPAERPDSRAPGRAQLSQAAGPLTAELSRPGERPAQQGDGGFEGSAAATGMD